MWFFFFILRMGRATLLKNAVSEVVAIRELVHWVTALVARVSFLFFGFFGHTGPFLENLSHMHFSSLKVPLGP